MSPPLVVTAAEMATAIRIFTESVAHVAGHRAEDVEEVEAASRTGSSGRSSAHRGSCGRPLTRAAGRPGHQAEARRRVRA